MKVKNPFDRKLEVWGNNIPGEVRDAATFVTDTMELCWASAQSIFKKKATPEIAVAIYDRVVKKIAEKNVKNQNETQDA